MGRGMFGIFGFILFFIMLELFINIAAGVAVLLPFLIVIGAFLFIVGALRQNAKNVQKRSRRNYADLNDTLHSPEDIARINLYLRKYFKDGVTSLELKSGEELRLNQHKYKSLDDIDVYINGHRFGTLYEYRINKGPAYNVVMDQLVVNALKYTNGADNIMDAEIITRSPRRKKDQQQEENMSEEEKANHKFIQKIDDLNTEIPDPEISNMMYETSALLKQLNFYQKKYPDNHMNYDKLYEYYLPMLVRIFEQYVALQSATHDPSYEETVVNLKKTIRQINKALRKMIADTTDQDFMNLSADISTLDALLKKDGYSAGSYLKTKEQEGENDA